MSERKLTKEQENKLQEILQEWRTEVEQHFEVGKDKKINPDQLDGLKTWELANLQRQYKKRINKELGLDFYKDVEKVEKKGHKKFSDIIVINPNGFPELPKGE